MSSRKPWLIGAVVVFLLVGVLLVITENPITVEQQETQGVLPSVSYMAVTPQHVPMIIQTFAEVKSRWNTVIKAQTSGEVTTIFPVAMVGERVKKNQRLIDIDNSRYQSSLDQAKQQVAEAELSLALEKNKSIQAKKNWAASGLSLPTSSLAFNIPQLKVAEAQLKAAKSQVTAARILYHHTKVKAPFTGVIVERHVNLGQTVIEGDILFRIQDHTSLNIDILLSQQQWTMLADNWHGQEARILDSQNTPLGRATIMRDAGVLDPQTRQHKLLLTVAQDATSSLIAGDFVKVEFSGRTVRNSLVVPESALASDGYIWYIDEDDKLRRFFATVYFYQEGNVVIDMPQLKHKKEHSGVTKPLRIATVPLASFLSSMKVKPVVVSENSSISESNEVLVINTPIMESH